MGVRHRLFRDSRGNRFGRKQEKEKEREDEKTKTLELDKLPVVDDLKDIDKFLGITSDERWDACKEYGRRMKEGAKDHEEEFGLKKELIQQTAQDACKRNFTWLTLHTDKNNPLALLSKLNEAPQDRPMWILKMLKAHGFKKVEIVQWIAADMFLSKWVNNYTQTLLKKMAEKITKGGIKDGR